MKNKLACATFGDSIVNETLIITVNSNNQQTICDEFRANAKRLAVSIAAAAAATEDDGNDCDSVVTCEIHDDEIFPGSIDNEERLVQAIIANCDRLNKEVGELFEMDSFLQDEDGGKDDIADCLMGCIL